MRLRFRKTFSLVAALLVWGWGPAIPEIPSDFTPFVRLGHLVKVSVYRNPIFDPSGQGIVNPGELVREEGPIRMPVGSGTIINAEGLILTNWHVYAFEDQVQYDPRTRILRIAERAGTAMLVYRLDDNDPLKIPELKFRADPVSLDEEHDLALLKIVSDAAGKTLDRRDFSYVQLGNPFGMTINEALNVLGYPGKGGDTITVTEGRFLGYYRDERFPQQDGFIKTNAAMSPGNSGGAALWGSDLIGVPTAVTLPELAGSDMGYIHPITWAMKSFVVARHKYELHPPDIPLDWLKSSYNSDNTSTDIFLTGHIVAANSGKGVESRVVAVRPDRTLEEISRLHQELESVAMIFLMQQMQDYGASPEAISRRLNVPLDRVKEMLELNLSGEAVSPDIPRYLAGEFFYTHTQSEADGFFIVSIPRERDVVIHVLNDGFFPFRRDIRSQGLGFQSIGRLKIFMR
jgi:S1-C subfamily serine protease